MTNFDRIKNMTEEELAKELCNLFDNDNGDDTYLPCDHCKAQGYCSVLNGNGMLRWLRREA